MSREYVERRVREALDKHDGSPARARQQIIAWTYEDPKLLQDLTRPHLTGIVAYAVSSVLSHAKDAQVEPVEPPDEPEIIDSPLKQAPGDAFGLDLLKALSKGGSTTFGLGAYEGAPRKTGQASKRHIETIREMARKSGKSSEGDGSPDAS